MMVNCQNGQTVNMPVYFSNMFFTMNCRGEVMNKEKCYEITDNCKKEIEQIVSECDGYDGNSTFLALQLIKDLDRLRKCISIDVRID